MRVYEQASKSGKLDKVIVATDDQRIFDAVKKEGGCVRMTSPDHPSGTDRCREIISKLEKEKEFFDIAVNIQGDEPFLSPEQIDLIVSDFEEEDIQIATLVKKIEDREEISNPNVVKVVVGVNNNALYFSRAAIPYYRDDTNPETNTFYKHIGIYAYQTQVLKAISQLKPSRLEIAESLEQLRWLENSYKIHARITTHESYGIDTPDDLKNLLTKLE